MPKVAILIVLAMSLTMIILLIKWRRQVPVVGKPVNQHDTVSISKAQRDQFTMTITDVFPIVNRGAGIVGVVSAGIVSVGDMVKVLSATGYVVAATTVSGVYANYKPAERAEAGDDCGLFLADLPVEQVERGGKIVAYAGNLPAVTNETIDG